MDARVGHAPSPKHDTRAAAKRLAHHRSHTRGVRETAVALASCVDEKTAFPSAVKWVHWVLHRNEYRISTLHGGIKHTRQNASNTSTLSRFDFATCFPLRTSDPSSQASAERNVRINVGCWRGPHARHMPSGVAAHESHSSCLRESCPHCPADQTSGRNHIRDTRPAHTRYELNTSSVDGRDWSPDYSHHRDDSVCHSAGHHKVRAAVKWPKWESRATDRKLCGGPRSARDFIENSRV